MIGLELGVLLRLFHSNLKNSKRNVVLNCEILSVCKLKVSELLFLAGFLMGLFL